MEPDERLYEVAMKEVATSPRTGLLAKCMAKSEGDENKAKARYIEIRVKEMKDLVTEGIKQAKARKRDEEAESAAKEAARRRPSGGLDQKQINLICFWAFIGAVTLMILFGAGML